MADNQTIPATAFSVSGSADGFSVQGSYPFINEIRSEDTTIAVSNGDSSPVNIQVTIRTNASTGSVLEFIRPRQENEQGQTEEIPGVHELALNQNADGILVAGGGVPGNQGGAGRRRPGLLPLGNGPGRQGCGARHSGRQMALVRDRDLRKRLRRRFRRQLIHFPELN